jgi:hypothetical protein
MTAHDVGSCNADQADSDGRQGIPADRATQPPGRSFAAQRQSISHSRWLGGLRLFVEQVLVVFVVISPAVFASHIIPFVPQRRMRRRWPGRCRFKIAIRRRTQQRPGYGTHGIPDSDSNGSGDAVTKLVAKICQ